MPPPFERLTDEGRSEICGGAWLEANLDSLDCARLAQLCEATVEYPGQLRYRIFPSLFSTLEFLPVILMADA